MHCSHFGSKYKLACCGQAALFNFGARALAMHAKKWNVMPVSWNASVVLHVFHEASECIGRVFGMNETCNQ